MSICYLQSLVVLVNCVGEYTLGWESKMRLPMTFFTTWFTESLNWFTHPGRLRQDQMRPARADLLALLTVEQGEQRSIFTATKHSGKESEQGCGNQKLHHIVVKPRTLVCPSFSCGEKIIKREERQTLSGNRVLFLHMNTKRWNQDVPERQKY